jgi:hypothetical protein
MADWKMAHSWWVHSIALWSGSSRSLRRANARCAGRVGYELEKGEHGWLAVQNSNGAITRLRDLLQEEMDKWPNHRSIEASWLAWALSGVRQRHKSEEKGVLGIRYLNEAKIPDQRLLYTQQILRHPGWICSLAHGQDITALWLKSSYRTEVSVTLATQSLPALMSIVFAVSFHCPLLDMVLWSLWVSEVSCHFA